MTTMVNLHNAIQADEPEDEEEGLECTECGHIDWERYSWGSWTKYHYYQNGMTYADEGDREIDHEGSDAWECRNCYNTATTAQQWELDQTL